MTPQQKLFYFRRFFSGRPDVFAVRMEDGSYRPRYAPQHQLTDSVVIRHMRGDIMIGAYPITRNGSCDWVAADFDGHHDNAFEHAQILVDKLRFAGIEPLCNTSQSGKGVHVRVIFDDPKDNQQPIEAWLARGFLNAFIEECELPHLNDGGAFDRTFPTQDDLSGGRSIGNQIAMPLHQLAAQQRGGAMLLDQNFDTIQLGDPTWSAIRHYKPIGREHILFALEDIGKTEVYYKPSFDAMRYRQRRRSGAPSQQPESLINEEYTAGDMAEMVENCDFFRYAYSDGRLSYFEWIAMAANLIPFDHQGGREAFHFMSQRDTQVNSLGRPRYDTEKTDNKYTNLLRTLKGPITCARIAEEGWRCPSMASDGRCTKFQLSNGLGPRAPSVIPRCQQVASAA